MSLIQGSTTPPFNNNNSTFQHVPQHLSRLQKIFTKRILANGLLPFLDLEKTNSYRNYKIVNLNMSWHNKPTSHRPRRKSILLPYVATHLRPSPSYHYVSPTYDQTTSNFLNAFGILKPVPNPPSNGTSFEKSNSLFEKRMILFNPPPPKVIILDEQYHINLRKFGGKTMKNDFATIVPTPFVFGRFNHEFISQDEDMNSEHYLEKL